MVKQIHSYERSKILWKLRGTPERPQSSYIYVFSFGIFTGNCIARVFNDHGQLNAGGFQLRLRGGMPSKDLVALTESSLDHHPVIPCCTVLIRILPHVSVSNHGEQFTAFDVCQTYRTTINTSARSFCLNRCLKKWHQRG